MSAYIPLIKTTRWIDLSPDHKNLRKELEQDTLKASVNKEQIQPIMLQGAFGIGKTNSLYYIFHYGWCKLKTPTFLISLDEITKAVKDVALKQPTGKIQNDQLGPFINKLLLSQIEALKSEDWSSLDKIFFPEFNGGDLNKYLKDFKQVEVIEDSKVHLTFDNTFSKSVILEAVNTSQRPILLIDEFESKFYELKKYIETSGGGVLRELFDQIVQDTNLFYLIIGNGPASGYEIAKERGDSSSDSETAANRRLKTKPIPFPTSNLLQRSFLKDDPKGYINFIWWLSRCRPGHILKLRDALGSIENLKLLNTNELITKSIFKEPIDEGGEAVSYLKTQFFNEINGRIQAAILGKVITEFQPIEFDIKEYKQDLRECVSYFLCSSENINTEIDLIPVLREDLYSIHLKKYQEEGKFDSVNYIEHIQPYFSYILSGISDAEGNIAFGMINDSKPDEVLASTFLKPLLELTYDFISLYQDDSIKETRESLDFILNIINQINISEETGELELFIPNIFDRFEKCKLLRNDKVFLQLSLYAIRESIEQPIGSPKLKYKNEQASALLADVNLKEALPLIFHKEENLYNYFIPALSNEILDKYLEDLQKHLYASFYEKFHKDGDIVIRVIYFDKNHKIDDFRTNLLYKDGDSNHPEAIYSLNKIDVVDLESYQLNFGSQIRDYIDSVSQLGIIGVSRKEPAIFSLVKDESILNLKDIIKVIGDRPWTEKKETIRTIEHYRKLLFDGDNSTFKSIHKIANEEYKAKLTESVCKQDEYRSNISDLSYLDNIIKDESEAYDDYTLSLALLFLFENREASQDLKNLLKIAKDVYKVEIDKSSDKKNESLEFKNLLQILTKNTQALGHHINNFDLESNFLSRLSNFTTHISEIDAFSNTEEIIKFLAENAKTTFLESYNSVLGTVLRPYIINTIYKLNLVKTFPIITFQEELSDSILKVKQRLSQVRTDIVNEIAEFKELLEEDKDLSNYVKILSKTLDSINLIEKITKETESHSLSILFKIMLGHCELVTINSEEFLNQLKLINQSIFKNKENVLKYQVQVDEFYNDPLAEKLIDLKFTPKRNREYFWKAIFLRYNMKSQDSYNKLISVVENKYALNPFSNHLIYDATVKNFQQSLKDVFDKKEVEFKKTISEMQEIVRQVTTTKQLQDYIAQLLTPVEE